jgi:hypothetical protein
LHVDLALPGESGKGKYECQQLIGTRRHVDSFTHSLTSEYMHALQEARRALDEAIRMNEKFDESWDQTKADALRQALSGFSPVCPSSAVPLCVRESARARERERERESIM